MKYPSLVFYADWAVRTGFAGMTYGPIVFIRPSHRHDAGLLRHEMEHVAQFWRTCGLHGLFYRFSRKYRLRSEVQAYREQLRFSPGHEALFAGFIADKYNLGITHEQALIALLETGHA